MNRASLFLMPYRRTENVVRKLSARRAAILAAAEALASESGMGAVQIAPVAERAGIAAGTVYRYFPSKTALVTALVEAQSAAEIAALGRAAGAAPGPLSALCAAIATFAARALARRRLAFALVAEPVEPEIEAARVSYRRALAGAFETRIRAALAGGHLPDQDAAAAAAALVGALIEGLIGPLAAATEGRARERVQALTLFALRALGVIDARARGLVVQAPVFEATS
jgi:AcrR family transcriptional regulator